MLTREEQNQIFDRAQAFAKQYAEAILMRKRRHSGAGNIEADEMIEVAEEELRDFLKEVG